MTNKILVKLYVPEIGEEYDIWIPINRRIHNVIRLLLKGINEIYDGNYNPINIPLLYDKETAIPFNINMSVREAKLQNGSELILL